MSFTEAEYERIREGCQRSAAAVVPYVYDLVKPDSVIDIGGGEGWWGGEFHKQGVEQVLVTDHEARDAVIPGVMYGVLDLEDDPLMLVKQGGGNWGLAVCLEVAEHLTEASGRRLVELLCKLSPVVLFSAAIPGQGGLGHINEQWPDYWVDRFHEHGYACSDFIRWRFWDNTAVEPWYRQNMILACDSVEDMSDMLQSEVWDFGAYNVVHPDIYQWRIEERDRARRVLYPEGRVRADDTDGTVWHG